MFLQQLLEACVEVGVEGGREDREDGLWWGVCRDSLGGKKRRRFKATPPPPNSVLT